MSSLGLTDAGWEKFFDTMRRMVNAPNVSWAERANAIINAAKDYGMENDLEEFVSCVLYVIDGGR